MGIVLGLFGWNAFLARVDQLFCASLSLTRLESEDCVNTESPTFAPSFRPTYPTDGSFSIKLVNMGDVDDYDHLFEIAALRWQSVILNDLPTVGTESFPNGDIFNGQFSRPLLEPVDDVTIGYEVGVIQGGFLGRAGPVHIRLRSGTTITGAMRFSSDFFGRGSDADVLIIVLHEIGHVLGIGGRWDNAGCDSGCTLGVENYRYTCQNALDQYLTMNMHPPIGTGTTLLVAKDGGRGTRCGHWDDESFNAPIWSEVMTPFFNPKKLQLLTKVTLGSLMDIGDYQVDFDAADPIPSGFEPDYLELGFSPDNEIDLTRDPIENTEPSFLDV